MESLLFSNFNLSRKKRKEIHVFMRLIYCETNDKMVIKLEFSDCFSSRLVAISFMEILNMFM